MSDQPQHAIWEALAPRGVYEHPYLGPNGEHIFVGIDQRGRRRFETTVSARHDASVVARALRTVLDDLDPPPLRLMD